MSAAHASDHHHDDPMSHVPPPSPWPFLLGAISLSLLCFGGLTAMGVLSTGASLLIFATVASVVTLMGWCHQVIKEKPIAHDLNQQQKDLFFFTKLFLVSEFTAFGAIFAYFYARAYIDPNFVYPPGLNLGNPLIGIATIILLSSSVTCEIAHHALLAGDKKKTRVMLLSTIILGVIFLGFQGFEYGEFIAAGYGFTSMPDETYNAFMSLFFISTGFHGFHLLTGLVMLTLVYVRLELGHFNPERHFSMMAASLYWHFVDVIWIFLFLTVYVLAPGAPGAH